VIITFADRFIGSLSHDTKFRDSRTQEKAVVAPEADNDLVILYSETLAEGFFPRKPETATILQFGRYRTTEIDHNLPKEWDRLSGVNAGRESLTYTIVSVAVSRI
jgi:hypothetical protein